MKKPNSQSTGFTLIEMMIVIAILGILAIIAIPSYDYFMRKGRRAEAKALLLSTQSELENCFLRNGTYLHSAAAPCGVTNQISTKLNSENSYYYIQLNQQGTIINTDSYTLTAIRSNAQVNDSCGDFRINNLHQRSIVNQNAGVTSKECWK